jgi:hypothetical protein
MSFVKGRSVEKCVEILAQTPLDRDQARKKRPVVCGKPLGLSHVMNPLSLIAPRHVPCRRKKTTPCSSKICFVSFKILSAVAASTGCNALQDLSNAASSAPSLTPYSCKL